MVCLGTFLEGAMEGKRPRGRPLVKILDGLIVDENCSEIVEGALRRIWRRSDCQGSAWE